MLIRLAAYSGLRAGELAAIKVRSLDLQRGSVHVTESISEVRGRAIVGATKTYATRSVSIPSFLVADLRRLLARKQIECDHDRLVFGADDGSLLRQSNFYPRCFKPAAREIGKPSLRFHDLRHTCAALLIAEGAHPRVLMERLGHSSVTTSLDRYGHLLPTLDVALTQALDARRYQALFDESAD